MKSEARELDGGSKAPPNLKSSSCSLRLGPNYIDMPKFAEAVEFSDKQIMQLLTELRTSQYYRLEPHNLETFLTPTIARRVLYTLLIMNDREKSNFEPITELRSMESSNL